MNVFSIVGTILLSAAVALAIAATFASGEATGALLVSAITVGIPGIVMRFVGGRVGKLVGLRPELLETGQRGTATVTGIGETGVTINNDPVVAFDLNVDVAGRAIYQVSLKQRTPRLLIGAVLPGSVVSVAVDPDDPQSVAIDWSAMPTRVQAEEPSPVTVALERRHSAAELLASGRRGTARIVAAEDAGDVSDIGLVEVGDPDDDDRLFVLELEVKVPGRPEYPVRIGHRIPEALVGSVGPGRRVVVAVDRDDEAAVAIDWDAAP